PAVEAASAGGRVSAVGEGEQYRIELRGFTLNAGEALRIEPTDADVDLGPAGGRLSVNAADVGVLAALSDHLPMPPEIRQQLAAHAPHGRVEDLRLEWRGAVREATLTRLQARLKGLSLQPQ